MLYDRLNEFSNDQAVTATALATDVIDTLPTNTLDGPVNTVTDLGGSRAMFLVVLCTEDATAGGAATLTITLESDSTANLATSPTVHFSTGALALAALKSGQMLVAAPLPRGDYEKYLGVRFTVATGPLTAGKFTAFLTREVQHNRYYQVGTSSNL